LVNKSATFGICVAASGFFGVQVSGSVCLVGANNVSTHTTEFGLVFTGGVGTGIPSYSLNGALLGSNAAKLHQLRGAFADVGGSVGQVVTGGNDFQVGQSSNNKNIYVDTPEVGFGFRVPDTPIPPIGFEIHGGVTDTVTWQFFNWHY
jgi:hypothetical protein